jgi:hypothetical protein
VWWFRSGKLRNSTLSLGNAVLSAARDGTELNLSDTVPDLPSRQNRVQAATIRDAIVGKRHPLHYRGLHLQGFFIEGDLDLSFARWSGELSLTRCRFTGAVVLDHAKVEGRIVLDGSHVRMVSAHNAAIDGAFLLRDGFTADEGFYGLGIRVSNALNLRGSHVIAPRSKPTRMAVELFRANLGDLFLSSSRFDGGVYASGITVSRNVRVQGSAFTSRRSLGWEATGSDFKGALTLGGSEIKGSLYLSTRTTLGKFRADGAISVRAVSCTQVFVHEEILRLDVELEGLIYKRLRGSTPAQLLRALGERDTLAPQAYVQLADYCQTVGDLATRRRVLVALERRLTRAQPAWSLNRALRGLHGVLVGYGYHATWAIPWLSLSVVLASALLRFYGSFLAPKKIDAPTVANAVHLSWSDSFGYTLDSLLPFASLGVKDLWVTHPSSLGEWGWLSVFIVLKFSAWGLVALALASFTGTVRKVH